MREKKRGYNVISERGEGRDIVGENIIGALKYEIIMEVLSNYSFFQYYDRNIGLFFTYCSPYNYHFPNFAIAKVVALNSMLHFLYWFCRLVHCFPYSYCSSKYLNALKSKKSDNYCHWDS